MGEAKKRRKAVRRCPVCQGPITRDEQAVYCSERCASKAGRLRRDERIRQAISKAERLVLAGEVAPVLRRRAHVPRRITLVDADGNPTRISNDVEVALGALKRADIELTVLPGKRPTQIICEVCRTVVPVKERGGIPKRCDACKNGRCEGCGGALPTRTTARRARQRGEPARCKACWQNVREKQAEQTREEATRERMAAAFCADCKAAMPPQTANDWTKNGPRQRRCRTCRYAVVSGKMQGNQNARGRAR